MINLILFINNNILDILLINTRSSKRLCFNIIKKGSVSNLPVNTFSKSFISIMPIFQQHLINILNVSSINNTRFLKKLYFIIIKKNPTFNFSINILNQIFIFTILVP